MNGFDPGDHAAPYIQQTMTGGNTGGNRYHWSDSTTLGIGHGDGKSKCLHNIQGDIDVQALSDKAEAWGRVYTHTKDVHAKLQAAYQRVFDNWSGDDADRARKTFGYTVDSAASVRDAAQGMHTGTTQLVTMANQVRGMGGGGPSTLGQVAHVETLGLIGAGGDGGELQPAFDAYCNGLGNAVTYYPSTMEWQVKTAPSTPTGPSVPPIGQQGGEGGGGGVSGVSAPHLGGGAGHGSVPTSGISNPGAGGTPHAPNPHLPHEPGLPGQGGGTDPGGFGGGDPGGGGGATFGSGSGAPGLDSGSSLAGYDPSSAFGGGAGGAGAPFGGAGGAGLGAGGGGVGGLGAAGLGAGGLGGGAAGGLAGAGAGGTSGLGAAGGLAGANAAEEASAAEAAGAGAAGRAGGQQGLLPMRPGGQSGNDSERERSTWLTEDDDIWGESDAPPSVIS